MLVPVWTLLPAGHHDAYQYDANQMKNREPLEMKHEEKQKLKQYGSHAEAENVSSREISPNEPGDNRTHDSGCEGKKCCCTMRSPLWPCFFCLSLLVAIRFTLLTAHLIGKSIPGGIIKSVGTTGASVVKWHVSELVGKP